MIDGQKNILKTSSLPKAIIFDTDNTLYPYAPAHEEATKNVELKIEKMLGKFSKANVRNRIYFLKFYILRNKIFVWLEK